ncbi:MAG TPA: APC family permease [Stackebrandtia sp.]|uniref:APC family permease n=1 Tax=Stackebrandtia sp. TaxID=2023065 RepID=UPI002D62BBAC|nr:APC family permease [Stackebrandtia sp.]HZE41317.1 APC family permease [Stackebrandtia sp.]
MSQPEGIERFGYRQELRRTIGFADLVFYGLIFMVPIAPFGIFGTSFQTSQGMVPLAYGVALVALIFTAWSYSQMSAAFPMTGGVYNYAGRGMGAPMGFIAGWMILLDYMLVPSLLYVIAGFAMSTAMAPILALPPWAWLLIFLAVNTIFNATGMKITLGVTRLFIVGELLVLGIFLVVGVVGIASGKAHFSFDPIFNPDAFSWKIILTAASVTVLSFLGFDGIALLAEENRGQAKRLGRAMTLALMLAGVLFIAQTWVASLFTDSDKLLHSNPQASDVSNAFYIAAHNAGGAWLATLCAAATALAWGIADSMVAQVASSRLMYAMARDRQLPRFLSKVSVRFGVPINAVFIASTISLLIGLTTFEFLPTSGGGTDILPALGMHIPEGDSINFLSSIVNFGAICSFLVLHLAVIWHFFFKQRTGKVFSHLIMPLCGLIVLGSVAWSTKSSAQYLGGSWLLLGVVILVAMYSFGRKPTLPQSLDATHAPVPTPQPSARG